MSTAICLMEEITIKEEAIWPTEEENSQGEASTEDGHNSSLPFENILVKTEPIKIEAVESNQEIEDELHSRKENSDAAITEIKDNHTGNSSVSSFDTEGGRCFPDQGHTCVQCGKAYTNSSVLFQSAEQMLYCSRKCKESLWSSMTPILKMFINNAGRELIACSHCDMIFVSHEKCLQHLEGHCDEKPFACPKCDMAFSHPTALERHLFTHVEAKQHRCKYCRKSFVQLASLLIHERTHTRQGEQCTEVFSMRSRHEHMATHNSEKGHKCFVCGKTFTRYYGLVQHMTAHKPGKVHKCSLCDKTFTRKYGLVQHVIIHNPEKDHKCTLCKKTFPRKYILAEHILHHGGQKCRVCSHCQKSFATRDDLVQHVRMYAGQCTFNCRECGERFSSGSDLSRHVAFYCWSS